MSIRKTYLFAKARCIAAILLTQASGRSRPATYIERDSGTDNNLSSIRRRRRQNQNWLAS